MNLFDPDGTRVELMEPDTVDGQPALLHAAPATVSVLRSGFASGHQGLTEHLIGAVAKW